jgi:acyl-CoA synthetase (AMP-forming)/AMP-acid ligase II
LPVAGCRLPVANWRSAQTGAARHITRAREAATLSAMTRALSTEVETLPELLAMLARELGDDLPKTSTGKIDKKPLRASLVA